MVLDCGFRGNGRRLGAMNHAPAKTYPCQPYGPPAAAGDGSGVLRVYGGGITGEGGGLGAAVTGLRLSPQ